MKKVLFLCLLAALTICGCKKEPEPVRVIAVSLNVTSLSLTEGETGTITATVSPSNAENKKVLWTTDHPEVATVSSGKVTAVKAGLATITASSEDGGKTATCSVFVKAETLVTLDKTEESLTVGETVTLTATVTPADATDRTVTWVTSNASIATVKDGVVTAVNVGTATIAAKVGDKTASCIVTVLKDHPLTITSVGNTSVAIAKDGDPYDITLEYRKGAGSWNAYSIGYAVVLSDGEKVQFRAGKGGNEKFSKGYENGYAYYKIVVTGNGVVNASGDIMSLLDNTLERNTVPEYGFYCLFSNCTKLIDAGKLRLSATNLAECCYIDMFSCCSSLTKAPVLPAITLAKSCYGGMFFGCSSLTQAPELPATTLAEHCYSSMFFGCSSLTKAPELPAITLADFCYDDMFVLCSSLAQAPELPATTLAEQCYSNMFSECTSLTKAPELPATSLAKQCYYRMFNMCTSLTQAQELLPATTLAESCYGDMFFGCSSLTKAPILPATTLVKGCYVGMFCFCYKLDYVKALFTSISSSFDLADWLSFVSTTGTFVKSKDATWDRDDCRIPEGWTVQTE